MRTPILREGETRALHIPWPSSAGTRSLSPHPWYHWQPPGLGPQCLLVIYGTTVSSRIWAGEPEIIYFVLSLSFKGSKNVLGKGVKRVSPFGFHKFQTHLVGRGVTGLHWKF